MLLILLFATCLFHSISFLMKSITILLKLSIRAIVSIYFKTWESEDVMISSVQTTHTVVLRSNINVGEVVSVLKRIFGVFSEISCFLVLLSANLRSFCIILGYVNWTYLYSQMISIICLVISWITFARWKCRESNSRAHGL